jgi:hypothetical protein
VVEGCAVDCLKGKSKEACAGVGESVLSVASRLAIPTAQKVAPSLGTRGHEQTYRYSIRYQFYNLLTSLSYITALLSVYDKTNLIDFARGLEAAGVRLLGSGGTAKLIRDSGIPIQSVVF